MIHSCYTLCFDRSELCFTQLFFYYTLIEVHFGREIQTRSNSGNYFVLDISLMHLKRQFVVTQHLSFWEKWSWKGSSGTGKDQIVYRCNLSTFVLIATFDYSDAIFFFKLIWHFLHTLFVVATKWNHFSITPHTNRVLTIAAKSQSVRNTRE